MHTASLTDAKNGFSALIERVRGGESVLILDRGVPVARLDSVVGPGEEDAGRLARLQRGGVVRPPRAADPDLSVLLSTDPPQPRGDGDAVAALLEERRAGR